MTGDAPYQDNSICCSTSPNPPRTRKHGHSNQRRWENKVWLKMDRGIVVCLALSLAMVSCYDHRDLIAMFRRRRSGSSDQLLAHYAAIRRPKLVYRQPTYVMDLWKEMNEKETVADTSSSNGKSDLDSRKLMALLNSQRRYRCRYGLAPPDECK